MGAALNVYLTTSSNSYVEVLDAVGRPLSRLSVLSDAGGGSTAPRMAFDPRGQLRVSDTTGDTILTVSPPGAIVQALRSPHATTSELIKLLQDPRTGDLLAGYSPNSAPPPWRCASPPATAPPCRATPHPSAAARLPPAGAGRGRPTGQPWGLFECVDGRVTSYRVHVLQASGRVQAGFALPLQSSGGARGCGPPTCAWTSGPAACTSLATPTPARATPSLCSCSTCRAARCSTSPPVTRPWATSPTSYWTLGPTAGS